MIKMNELSYTHTYWVFLLPLIGVCADIITGWIQATVNGTWDSTKMRKGLYRKTGELLLVVLAWAIGLAVALPVNIAAFVSGYIVIMELLSVIENLDQAGIPIPKRLVKMLKKAKDKWEGDDDLES